MKKDGRRICTLALLNVNPPKILKWNKADECVGYDIFKFQGKFVEWIKILFHYF